MNQRLLLHSTMGITKSRSLINYLIFQSPHSTYIPESYPGELFFIPRDKSKKKNHKNQIPCLYLPGLRPSKNIILYYHGNADDIGMARYFLKRVQNAIKIPIIAPEFVGYGINLGVSNDFNIIKDCHHVIEFIVNELKVLPENLIVFGRSIGTGPALHISTHFNIGGLCLMSPFISLNGIVSHMKGIAKNFSCCITDRFANNYNITQVRCPILFLHGMHDSLIPVSHSVRLCENSIKASRKALHLSKTAEHDLISFDEEKDIFFPFLEFFSAELKQDCTDIKKEELPIESDVKKEEQSSDIRNDKDDQLPSSNNILNPNGSNNESTPTLQTKKSNHRMHKNTYGPTMPAYIWPDINFRIARIPSNIYLHNLETKYLT